MTGRPADIPVHLGTYIREHVLPRGMSVKTAAQLVGVGRPALSNLLNGKAALSAEMAARLEKTLSTDRDVLLRLQSAFE